MAITQEQIAIVKSTAPVLKEHGTAITTVFYETMLGENPSLKNMFSLRNQQTGAQQKALANAVLGYATYIDDLPRLHHAVERIAHKHASLFVEPAQYAIVGTYLMRAIGTVLGDALTPEIAEAWTAAYAQLADVFVAREQQLYAEHGSWTGWRAFRILRRIDESESVTSFYLAPTDGATPLPAYLPGQYVSLRLPVPELDGLKQIRQFSLSEAPRAEGEYYRISVKREDTIADASVEDMARGLVPGLISNMLHSKYQPGDEVELSPPQGEFFVNPADESKAATPLVMISAGVGATPMMAIVDSVLAPQSKTRRRPMTWVQGSRSSATLCFAGRVRQMCRDNANLHAHVFLGEVRPGDLKGQEYDFGGVSLDLARLDRDADLFLADPSAEYYVCGPEPWMVAVRATLTGMGVSLDRISLELFATGDVPAQ
jgi:nitric oxide dioxygenase